MRISSVCMELQHGFRYRFKYKDGANLNKIVKCRATVVDVLDLSSWAELSEKRYKTLRVIDMVREYDNILIDGVVSIPYDWIQSSELLVIELQEDNSTPKCIR